MLEIVLVWFLCKRCCPSPLLPLLPLLVDAPSCGVLYAVDADIDNADAVSALEAALRSRLTGPLLLGVAGRVANGVAPGFRASWQKTDCQL